MGTREDHLFRRGKSGIYYARFQYPAETGEPERKFSLKTTDRAVALSRIAFRVAEHKAYLAALASISKNRDQEAYLTTVAQRFEEGEHHLDDGSRVIVAQGTALICKQGGSWEPFDNTERREVLYPMTPEVEAWMELLSKRGIMHLNPEFGTPVWRSESRVEQAGQTKSKPKAKADRDELTRLVEFWIEGKKRSKHIANEARGVLAVWHEISGGKAIRDARREDGKKLREHLFAIGNKLPTVQKKIGHLRAALKYAALEDVYNGPNPFTALITSDIKKLKKRQSVAGKPFTEEDMAKVRASLADWNDPDAKLLWVLCATTGMRRGEAYLIEGEQVLAGNLRCITLIPTNEDDTIKNDESERMIPIPADAIPFLPARITGRLFEGDTLTVGGRKLARDRVSVGKRLLRHLKNLGVLGPGKNLRSTRHRAAQRMKNARLPNGTICPPDLRREVLGHEFEDVHDGIYARGYPMDMLKEWMDQIGLGPIASSASK
ncbi:hypothetical protein [Methylorubrum thiocyanatum]|uniref:hypothetical protein n=1 Tax=Methylorubrum thiocyanatum TaxID=47958 RepID=UPI003F7DEB35